MARTTFAFWRQAAGFVVTDYHPDVDGVDLGIVSDDRPLVVHRAPRIDVQVKTASNLQPVDGVLRFDGLDGRQHNRLAGPRFLVPRYLFLITVPREPSPTTRTSIRAVSCSGTSATSCRCANARRSPTVSPT